ncbi:hypothetical protein [Streptomyces antimicrobicus]|uniref:Uncharacterized protein n=1 Tax=Streptomyces antimicrobicus TaxID=2883108 RepID=A0ABS8B2U8_9ACTN|nr:hypothetical protein [Streptomyces antimicrobicus]MCB5178931.1 hypothetical protein [Streptomyces antimicrobicus]
MTYDRESVDLPEDRGCLRWVLGVPLVLIHGLNAFLVFSAVAHGPQGAWDDQGYAGTTAACVLAIALSLLGLAVTAVPSVRRTMGRWWFAPPVVLGTVAFVRAWTLN